MRSCIVIVVVGVTGLVVGACRSSEPAAQPQQQQQQPPPPQGGDGPCGVRLFNAPACQAAVDQVCCPMSMECAKDPNCLRLSQCWLACKGQGDNCANGCGVRSRYEHCNAVCQGRGNDCVTSCAQQPNKGEPAEKFLIIANCSKNVRYPSGVTCNDRT